MAIYDRDTLLTNKKTIEDELESVRTQITEWIRAIGIDAADDEDEDEAVAEIQSLRLEEHKLKVRLDRVVQAIRASKQDARATPDRNVFFRKAARKLLDEKTFVRILDYSLDLAEDHQPEHRGVSLA